MADLSTPAVIQMSPLPKITVTFILEPPTETIARIRTAINYAQTGGIYADTSQGSFASRMPLLTRNEDGTYSIQLSLYAGSVFRYKYTLGNGFINAERDKNSGLVLRSIVLPDQDVTIRDKVDFLARRGQNPTIIAQTPESTPPGDSVSIQFITNHAHQPIPMWPMGEHQWMFIFFGSSSMGTATYRFARNDQVSLSVDPSAALIHTGSITHLTPLKPARSNDGHPGMTKAPSPTELAPQRQNAWLEWNCSPVTILGFYPDTANFQRVKITVSTG